MSEHRDAVELAPAVGPVVAHVPIPPEIIVASGVGHQVTNWHRDLLQAPEDGDADQDRDESGGAR